MVCVCVFPSVDSVLCFYLKFLAGFKFRFQ